VLIAVNLHIFAPKWRILTNVAHGFLKATITFYLKSFLYSLLKYGRLELLNIQAIYAWHIIPL
jgi:hypothetical protein